MSWAIVPAAGRGTRFGSGTPKQYQQVLGLQVVDRPRAAMPAAIVSIGSVQVVHLFQATPEQDAVFARLAPADAATAEWRTGRLHHVGFWATGIAAFRARLQQHGIAFRDPRLVIASLDHTLWLHRPFRADEWLLYMSDTPAAFGARGFVRGQVFTRDGRLVASAAQEGLIRLREPK